MPERNKKMRELIEKNPDTVTRMALIDFDMGMFKDPEDAFLNFNVSEGVYMRYAEARIKALAKVISERTGADPAQIIDPNTRTPEQQEMIFELSGRETMNRIHAYLESNYLSALNLIHERAEQSGDNIYAIFWDVDRAEPPEDKLMFIPRLAALYFFALRTDINPREKGAFDAEENRTELLQVFDRMDIFYREHRAALQTDSDFVTAFIRASNISTSMRVAHKRRSKAQETGALETRISEYLPTIAEKSIGFDYFTAKVIKQLPTEISELALDKETGELSLYDINIDGKPLKERLKEIDRIHTGFLFFLFGLAVDNDLRVANSRNPVLSIYAPAILKAIGKDPRPTSKKRNETNKPLKVLRRDAFMEFLKPLLNFVALFGGSLFQIVGLQEYDINSETVYLNVPYMYKLAERIKLSEPQAAIVKFFSAKVVSENQTAVEVANRIAIGLIERGVTYPDAKVNDKTNQKPVKRKTTRTATDGTKIVTEETFEQTPVTMITRETTDKNGNLVTISTPHKKKEKPVFTYRVKFSTIIDECPNLANELKVIHNDAAAKNNSARINKKLNDVFTAAVNLILQKSVAPEFYLGLTITTDKLDTFKAPTNSTLKSSVLVIRHNGQNPEYQQKQ